MNTTFNTLLLNTYHFVKNQVSISLTPSQKKIALYVCLYFSLIGLGFCIYRCFVNKRSYKSTPCNGETSPIKKINTLPEVQDIQQKKSEICPSSLTPHQVKDKLETQNKSPLKVSPSLKKDLPSVLPSTDMTLETQATHSLKEAFLPVEQPETPTTEVQKSEDLEVSDTEEATNDLSEVDSQSEDEDSAYDLLIDNPVDDEESRSPTPVKSSSNEKDRVLLNGKRVSKRTLNCLKLLEKILTPSGKVCGQAIDNGDCFFDAFAQLLSLHLKRKVTIKELRQIVSDYVHKLDQGPEEDNWIKKMIQKEYIKMDTYESYKEYIGYTCEEALQKKWVPIWGQQGREGVILCRHFKVNLIIHEVGCNDDAAAQVDDMNNYWESDPAIYPRNETYTDKIEIGLYPGHFVPIFNKPLI